MKPGVFTSIDGAGIGAMALVTAAVYFGAVAPLKSSVQEAKAQAQVLAQRREELESADAQGRALADSLARVELELSRLETRLERGTQINARVRRITALAEEAGLTITSFTPGQEIAGKRFGRVPIALSGKGGYPAFAAFLGALHAQYRDIQVVAFKLSGRPTEADSAAAFDAELVWYTALESAASADRAGLADAGAATSAGAP